MKRLTPGEQRNIVAAVVAPGGSFVAAICKKCRIVKQPLRDMTKDDGQICDRCKGK